MRAVSFAKKALDFTISAFTAFSLTMLVGIHSAQAANPNSRDWEVRHAEVRKLQPRVALKLVTTSNGREVLMIDGEDLCSADFFAIRVTDTLANEAGWYKADSGKHYWAIKKGKESGRCTVDMQVSKEILKPGNLIEVRTFKDNGGGFLGQSVHRFVKAIPCTEQEMIAVFVGGIVISTVVETEVSCKKPVVKTETVVVVTPAVPVPPAKPAEPVKPVEPALSCQTQTEKLGSEKVVVNYLCNKNVEITMAKVIDAKSGNTLCLENYKAASNQARELCVVPRDPTKSFAIRTELVTSSEQGKFTNNYMLVKEATFTSFVTAKLLTQNVINVSSREGIIVDRVWSVRIAAQVFDADVDASEGQRLIKVELVRQVGDRYFYVRGGFQAVYANSGDVVEFNLEHTYNDGWFSSGDRGDLDRGANKLYLRVYDAYTNDQLRYVDYPVQVNLN